MKQGAAFADEVWVELFSGLRRVKDFNHTLSLRWYLSCLYPGDCRKQDPQENGQLGRSHDSFQ